MEPLRNMFGPSKEEVWSQLCSETVAKLSAGGFLENSKVEVRQGEWTITLDVFSIPGDQYRIPYTRIRAPYINKDGFRFLIYRKSIFSGLKKMLGMQDVEVGFPQFDEDFIIKGDPPHKLRQLFENQRIRDLISAQPRIHFEIKDDEGWFKAQFPRGVDELFFRTPGVIKDVERLKQLFDLFAEVLNHLCQIDSAYETDPGIRL